MSAMEKTNLARIRDNQRRSRARRKEYLTELEARLRQCELQGIEASSEIQIAARRVADENRKLRELLAHHGINDESIESYLQSSSNSGMDVGGHSGRTSATVQALDQLLQTRKACCTDSNTPMTTSINIGAQGSSGSTSIVQAAWDETYNQNPGDRRRTDTCHTNEKATGATHQFITPSTSAASRTSSASAQSRAQSIRALDHNAPLHMPRNPGHHYIPLRNHQVTGFLDSHRSLASESHALPSSQHVQGHFSLGSDNLGGSSVYTSSGQLNVNSCGYATEMITTMAAVDPALVRSDLGCTGIDPGMDCEVDNHVIFNVMDRYSGSVG